MIYTPLTKKALKISFEAHKEQFDKSGIPYVYHPYELASQMTTEAETCVALLHDIVEDTSTTFEDLINEGFDGEIIDAIRLMTHNDGSNYFDYVKRIKQNPIAKAVKLADLRHNSTISRLDEITPKDLERVEKYKQAIEILQGNVEERK